MSSGNAGPKLVTAATCQTNQATHLTHVTDSLHVPNALLIPGIYENPAAPTPMFHITTSPVSNLPNTKLPSP